MINYEGHILSLNDDDIYILDFHNESDPSKDYRDFTSPTIIKRFGHDDFDLKEDIHKRIAEAGDQFHCKVYKKIITVREWEV